MFKHFTRIKQSYKTMSTNSEAPIKINFLDMPSGHRVAYEKVQGSVDRPTVVYVPGFMKGKDEVMPMHLREYCVKQNYTFVRYDPTCIGDSYDDLNSIEFQDWVENAGNVLEHLGSEENILIGSSMGAWISLWLGTQRLYQEKIKGMLLIAPAVNFLRIFYADIYKKLPEDAQEALDRGEIYRIQDESGMTPLKKTFAENSAKFELDFNQPIQIECPIKILHGVADDIIPYTSSLRIMEKVVSKELELIYRKQAEHRLDDEESLKSLEFYLEKLVQEIKT